MRELGIDYPNDDELETMIKEEVRKLKITLYPMDEVKRKVKKQYDSSFSGIWKVLYDNYIQVFIVWALRDISKEKLIESPIEKQMYTDLERYENRDGISANEKKRVEDIVSMLRTQGIFPKDEKSFYTLNEVMKWLDTKQCQVLVDAILVLKEYCDAEGVRSVLESADVNGIKDTNRVLIQNPNDTKHSATSIKPMADAFVTRLGLMTEYVKQVANTTYKGRRFCDSFWIRSTGSDPHCDGRHALFLVNKVSGDIDFVYKPHDLSADNMIVGETGMLQALNEYFKVHNLLPECLKKDEDPFAFETIEIDVENHIEKFVTKKPKMTLDEAKKYFYRAGLLKAITDAMAVIDLHRDNIMPTLKNAPQIIDAEVDFFRYASSGLENDALREDEYEDRFTNASFEVKGESERSGALFKKEGSKYYEEYKKGREFMCKLMIAHKDEFADMYGQYLQSVGKVRIVPIKTTELNQGLMEYIIGDKGGYFLKLINKIKKLLNGDDDGTSDFIFNKDNKLKIQLDKAKLGEDRLDVAIKQALDAATIIAMYVDMDGKIYLNDTKVGNIINIYDGRDVDKERIIGVMKNSFLNVIDDYIKEFVGK